MSIVKDREYRILFGDRTLSDDEIDAITDITVEQTVDMIWEAGITMSINVDQRGIWNIQEKDFAKKQMRARIEIKNENRFVCLIDGPIVDIDVDMRSEPGRSSITLKIYDDSILLDNDEEILIYNRKKGTEIADEIYGDAVRRHILGSLEVLKEVTPSLPKTINFRGTRMQLLRMLAKENQVYAYVLPGNLAGKSVGHFNACPKKPPVFANLVLLGETRNVESFKLNINVLKPSKVKVSSLDPIKKKISPTFSSNYQDFKALGDVPAVEDQRHVALNAMNPSIRLLHPYSTFSDDTEQMAKDQANKSGYAVEATGHLLQTETDTYQDILTPYGFITVEGVNSLYCGVYFITKVIHKITPMNFTQSFTMIRNAFSDTTKFTNMEIIA
jgi:hypothetical protein